MNTRSRISPAEVVITPLAGVSLAAAFARGQRPPLQALRGARIPVRNSARSGVRLPPRLQHRPIDPGDQRGRAVKLGHVAPPLKALAARL
jgi:hypothetical protein